MKKLLVLVALIFFSFNINAAISQSGITNLKQLDSNGIIELISGNQLTGFISDGPLEGPVVQTFFKNGKYETIFEGKIYKGVWKVENKQYCSKNNTSNNFNCVYWYTGNKDGGTYAYIVAQGKIFHQYHELKSVVQAKAEEKKKAAELKRIADAKKAEEKKKAAELKRIADAKKAEEKKKAAELKRVADAKKAEEKKKKSRYPDLSSIFYEHPSLNGISIAQKAYNNGDYATAFKKLVECSDESTDGYVWKDVNGKRVSGYNITCPVYLGMMHLEGIGTEQNTKLALKVLSEWKLSKYSESSSFHDWSYPRVSKYYEELIASANKKLNEERKADGKTVVSDAFSIIYEYEHKGTKYQVLQEYKSNNTVTEIWKGDDGSSYLDYKKAESPIRTWKWQYDESDSSGERFIYSEVSVDCLTSACATVTSGVFADYIYDFDNNIVTVVKREDGSIWNEGGTKIISHNFGNSSKKIGENFINTTERKSLNNCSDIKNNKIDADVRGYKDVFFGMTKDEFRILARCNNGSLYDQQEEGYVQDDSRRMGDDLVIYEGTYKYPVNAIFSGPGVTEIIVRTYSEYHNVMRINSKSSGVTGIDKIKDLLEKKYSLLIKPSDESIEKYNEYIGWNEVDFVFQNKDTQNLVILRVGYALPDALGLKYSYQGYIHYLSKRASETYLNNIQSEALSEDDF